MKPAFAKLLVIPGIVCAVCLLTLTTAQATHTDDMMWSVEFQEMLMINKAAYPDYNWGPYLKIASKLGNYAHGDDAAVRSQLEEVSTMLGKGDMDEDARADLINYVNQWKAALTPRSKRVRSK
jgi:hypothetical protein